MGNTCDKGHKPKPFTIDDLKNLKINDIHRTPKENGGCGPQGGHEGHFTKRGFDWPRTGEFEWVNLNYHETEDNRCWVCSDPLNGYGCSNCPDGGSLPGVRGAVKRVAYKADKKTCCITQQQVIGDKTCDPNYNYSSDTCNTDMHTYCSEPGNEHRIFSYPNCVTWSKKHPDMADQNIQKYCSMDDNIAKKQECKNYCTDNNKGWCDTAIELYCKNNPSDTTLCGCYNIDEYKKPPYSNIPGIIPECHIPSCTNPTAYKTKAMKETKCPTLDVCSQYIDAEANSVNLTGTVNFSCDKDSSGLNKIDNKTLKPINTTSEEPIEQSNMETGDNTYNTINTFITYNTTYIYIALAIIFIILFFIIIYKLS